MSGCAVLRLWRHSYQDSHGASLFHCTLTSFHSTSVLRRHVLRYEDRCIKTGRTGEHGRFGPRQIQQSPSREGHLRVTVTEDGRTDFSLPLFSSPGVSATLGLVPQGKRVAMKGQMNTEATRTLQGPRGWKHVEWVLDSCGGRSGWGRYAVRY